MSVTTATRESLPTGTWGLDPIHSTIGFEVEYLVGTFRGQFRDVQAKLVADGDSARLTGSAKVGSIDVKDENLAGHLQSPDFFDAERHPELTFESTDIRREGDQVTIAGQLALKGVTQPVVLTGTISDPVEHYAGGHRIGLKVETTIDRTAFGVDWNAPLPDGNPALANEVKLVAELFFAEEA
jgi:polyisoprenoid-binding protein YceI